MAQPSYGKLFMAIALATIATSTMAQQFVYPAKGQSAERQKKDEYECHQWAVQQTGFDPTRPAPATHATPSPPTTATGVTPGAGIVGAAKGAIVGKVVGGDAGAGAAAGAVAARGASRRANVTQAQHQQTTAQQEQQNKQSAYAKARSACLEGRGYSVK